MAGGELILFLLLLAVAGSLLALAIPLVQGWVPPNSFYGFRTPATMRDSAAVLSGNLWLGRRRSIARLFDFFGRRPGGAVVGLFDLLLNGRLGLAVGRFFSMHCLRGTGRVVAAGEGQPNNQGGK